VQEVVRFGRAFDSGCVAAASLLVSHVQHVCDLLLLRLDAVRGMALASAAFGPLRLREPPLGRAVAAAAALQHAAAAAIAALQTAQSEARLVCRWLLSGMS
jgi:hypothetical protein